MSEAGAHTAEVNLSDGNEVVSSGQGVLRAHCEGQEGGGVVDSERKQEKART